MFNELDNQESACFIFDEGDQYLSAELASFGYKNQEEFGGLMALMSQVFLLTATVEMKDI